MSTEPPPLPIEKIISKYENQAYNFAVKTALVELTEINPGTNKSDVYKHVSDHWMVPDYKKQKIIEYLEDRMTKLGNQMSTIELHMGTLNE